MITCSIHSTRPSRLAWAWDYRSVVRSPKRTADDCGRPRMHPGARSFSSPCIKTMHPEPVSSPVPERQPLTVAKPDRSRPHFASTTGVPTANPKQLTKGRESVDSSINERCCGATMSALGHSRHSNPAQAPIFVRYAPNSVKIIASQRNDATCPSATTHSLPHDW